MKVVTLRVKLDRNAILKRLDYYVSIELKNFLNDNEGKVFTAEKQLEYGFLKLYTLKEDNHSPKYVFYEKDFIVLEDNDK
jgi:hypothetical protein